MSKISLRQVLKNLQKYNITVVQSYSIFSRKYYICIYQFSKTEKELIYHNCYNDEIPKVKINQLMASEIKKFWLDYKAIH